MPNALYTAQATVTGGRIAGHGVTSDGALDVQMRMPPELGGEGGGTESRAAVRGRLRGLFRGRAGHGRAPSAGRDRRRRGASAASACCPRPNGGFKLAVELEVVLPEVQDPAEATQLVADAHAVCPYSNATRGNIEVHLTANGHELP